MESNCRVIAGRERKWKQKHEKNQDLQRDINNHSGVGVYRRPFVYSVAGRRFFTPLDIMGERNAQLRVKAV